LFHLNPTKFYFNKTNETYWAYPLGEEHRRQTCIRGRRVCEGNAPEMFGIWDI